MRPKKSQFHLKLSFFPKVPEDFLHHIRLPKSVSRNFTEMVESLPEFKVDRLELINNSISIFNKPRVSPVPFIFVAWCFDTVLSNEKYQ